MTTPLLDRHGFAACRYISLERLVESTKEEYYAVLKRCSAGWHEGENEIVPWLNYFLGLVRRGYAELSERVEVAEDTDKSELIRQTIMGREDVFTLAKNPCRLSVRQRTIDQEGIGGVEGQGPRDALRPRTRRPLADIPVKAVQR